MPDIPWKPSLSNRPGLNAFKCAEACLSVQPGLRRPITVSHQMSRLSIPPPQIACAQTGNATSKFLPTSSPKNDGGVTPITSNR
jgi:hypothetical protein